MVTYIQKPEFFDEFSIDLPPIEDIKDARVLAYLGDSITTDHISPAGSFTEETPSGIYLNNKGVNKKDFNIQITDSLLTNPYKHIISTKNIDLYL